MFDKGSIVLKIPLPGIWIKICTLIIAGLSVFILPSILLITLPVLVIRLGTKKFAKILRPDLAEMLTASSHVFAHVEDFKHPKTTVLGRMKAKGRIDFDTVLNEVDKKLIKARLPNGKLLYPELQQYITSWLGFKFWKQDPNFNLRNHLRVLKFTDHIVEKEDLRKISEELLTQSYNETQSPWDISILHNVRHEEQQGNGKLKISTDNTVIFCRFNHSLCDGYSILKIILRVQDDIYGDSQTNRVKINFPAMSIFHRVILPLKLLYSFAEIVMLIPLKAPWKVDGRKQTGQCHVQTVQMDIRDFKKLKNLYNTSFTSVVYAVVAGALRSTLLKQGHFIPKTLPCLLPIPKHGHPETLQNHFTLGTMLLPIGETDGWERVKLCNEFYANLKSSASPIVADILMRLFGSYFNFIGKLINHNDYTAVSVSYLPLVGIEKISLFGAEVIEENFFMGLMIGSSGASILVTTLGEHVSASVVVDNSIASLEEVNYLAQEFPRECETLKSTYEKLQSSKVQVDKFGIVDQKLK